MKPSIIVGLGNPGTKYEQTRHNVGFEVIDLLAKRWQIRLTENRRFKSLVGQGSGLGGRSLWLVKPQTYMNCSGEAVRAILNWYKLTPQDLLIVYDEMALPLGKLRLRPSGSAAGHNGMRSLIEHLNTQDFPRLRVGIDAPQTGGQDTIGHVLGRFRPEEKAVVAQIIPLAADVVEWSIKQGVEAAMNRFNAQQVTIS